MTKIHFLLSKVNDSPIYKTLSVASVSYLGFKTSKSFPQKNYPLTNAFGKSLSLVSILGIVHFSGLSEDKIFLDCVSFKFFRWGPFKCSSSLKNIFDMSKDFFNFS